MSFVITGLDAEPFRHLFGLPEQSLTARNVVRRVADAPVGFPCRVTLEDAPVGEMVLLINFEHLPVESPYRSRHAIFVRESAAERRRVVDEIPPALAVRKAVALRAFDHDGMLVQAELSGGEALPEDIERMLANPAAAFIHAHNPTYGCYLARIDRAS